MNYSKELRMGIDNRRKRKVKKATELAKRMKKVQEKAEVVLRKSQENMKQQADRRRK